MPRRRALLSGLVVMALLAATVTASYLAYESERDEAEAADMELVERVAAEASDEIARIASGLRGASGIVDKDGGLDPVRFRAFAREVTKGSPALGLSWAPRIDDEERAAFEAKLGRTITELSPDGEVTPLRATSDSYLPIAVTYPNTTSRRQLLGLDTLSDPTRAEVAQSAIRVSEPRLSPPLTIVQTQETGAGVYAPVTLNIHGVPQTVGLMISGIPGTSIAQQVSRRLGLEGRIAISDDGVPLTEREHGEGDVSTQTEVLGRRWQVSVAASTST
jgi:CHASE1-domain containing sensor protein